MQNKKVALISVYNKNGIVELATFLQKNGYSIFSTGGTADTLKLHDINVTAISDYTGFDEILDGRVKTLHPIIHAGLLADTRNQKYRRQIDKLGIHSIEVLVVNLYPFQEKARLNLSKDELMEFIDIGGSTMLRAAAKNYRNVTVICDPSDYGAVMSGWHEQNGPDVSVRKKLATKVFTLCSLYDGFIARYLNQSDSDFPEYLHQIWKKSTGLRYGENPHQKSAWYIPAFNEDMGALSNYQQHQGKSLSFNNIRDLNSAWRCVCNFETPACVGVKHASVCSASLAEKPLDAWRRTKEADPVSIFGGVAAFNRTVDEETALALNNIFLELVAAPAYSAGALKVFSRKKNVRILSLKPSLISRFEGLPVDGGLCFQEVDSKSSDAAEWTAVTKKKPNNAQMADLQFAWKLVKHVKSNAIVLAQNQRSVGIGTGQPNRVGAARMALQGNKVQNAVMASDAFFPFNDTVKLAADFGICAIIQPGGSIRDNESIDACNEKGIAMVFTHTSCDVNGM